jgi:hypothetical protein
MLDFLRAFADAKKILVFENPAEIPWTGFQPPDHFDNFSGRQMAKKILTMVYLLVTNSYFIAIGSSFGQCKP